MTNHQPPLVSVVVPAFNRAETITRTLDSLVAQTYSPIEVIVVDDASSDDTVEVVAAHPSAHNFQIIALGKNGGACRARNHGLAAASGTYVAFLDSDDVWEPRFLEALVGLIAAADPDVGCAAASYRTVLGDGRLKSRLLQHAKGDISKRMLDSNMVGATSCVLIRTEIARQVGGFNEAYPAYQDYELFIRLSRATRFISTEEILYTHIDWDDPGRLTRKPKKRLKALMMLYRDYLRDHLRGNPAARATFAGYVADQLMRAGRPRQAFRLFLLYAWSHRTQPKNMPHILMAMARVHPAFYVLAINHLSRLEQLLLSRIPLRPSASSAG